MLNLPMIGGLFGGWELLLIFGVIGILALTVAVVVGGIVFAIYFIRRKRRG